MEAGRWVVKKGELSASVHRCEACGLVLPLSSWTNYFCPECGGHQNRMYKREHYNPGYARTLTNDQIREEYAKAGMEWRTA